ncbi:hypothetical protein B0H17DRAFT_897291, partial [Mycena rosella]
LDEYRAKALNAVQEYFTLLRDVVNRYDIQFKNIYNLDEKGIQLGIGSKVNALVDRDQKVV